VRPLAHSSCISRDEAELLNLPLLLPPHLAAPSPHLILSRPQRACTSSTRSTPSVSKSSTCSTASPTRFPSRPRTGSTSTSASSHASLYYSTLQHATDSSSRLASPHPYRPSSPRRPVPPPPCPSRSTTSSCRLIETMWDKLALNRIYTMPRGVKAPDYTSPVVLRRSQSTVEGCVLLLPSSPDRY